MWYRRLRLMSARRQGHLSLEADKAEPADMCMWALTMSSQTRTRHQAWSIADERVVLQAGAL